MSKKRHVAGVQKAWPRAPAGIQGHDASAGSAVPARLEACLIQAGVLCRGARALSTLPGDIAEQLVKIWQRKCEDPVIDAVGGFALAAVFRMAPGIVQPDAIRGRVVADHA